MPRGRPRGKSKYEYALYKGEEFLDIGTCKQLSEKWNISEKTIWWLAFSKRKEKYKFNTGYYIVPLGKEQEDDNS